MRPVDKTLRAIRRRLRGEIVWDCHWDRQLNLDLSMGAPRLRIRLRRDGTRSVRAKGRYWLWIFFAQWRIRQDGRVIATKRSRLAAKLKACQVIDGQRLDDLALADDSSTRFTFDLGGEIEVFPYKRDRDVDLWTLHGPKHACFTVFADGTWEVGDARAMPDPQQRLPIARARPR